MKNEILKLSTVVLLLLFIGAGCKNHDIPDELPPQTLFDTLQGVWNWSYEYNYRKGFVENEFETTVHFLSINIDSTINYKTYKGDTLKKSGVLNISDWRWGRKIEPDILLHYNVTNENCIQFVNSDTIMFRENIDDNPFYYYVKNNLKFE